MTTAGIALIAGGLATLVGFRRALWAGGGRRRERVPRAIEAPRRPELPAGPARTARALPAGPALIRPALPASRPALEAAALEAAALEAAALEPPALEPAAPDREAPDREAPDPTPGPADDGAPDAAESAGSAIVDPAETPAPPGSRRGRRWTRPSGGQPLTTTINGDGDDRPVARFGLASIGLADEDDLDESELDDGPRTDTDADPGTDEDDDEDYEDEAAEPDDEIAEPDDEPAAEDLADWAYTADGAETAVEDVPVPREEEPAHVRMSRAVLARSHDTHPELAEALAEAAPRYGDRVAGWVRPQYEPDSSSGDYWTPIPESAYAGLDASGYGWPVPVERLPRVPPTAVAADEPAAEPTAVVLQWPPVQPSSRIGLPRNGARAGAGDTDVAFAGQRWDAADRDGRDGWQRAHGPEDSDSWLFEGDGWEQRDQEAADSPGSVTDGVPAEPQRPRRRPKMLRRRASAATEFIPALGDSTQMLPSLNPAGGERRPRPRPRPNPAAEARSTVYVSRHAAEPS